MSHEQYNAEMQQIVASAKEALREGDEMIARHDSEIREMLAEYRERGMVHPHEAGWLEVLAVINEAD